IVQKDLQFGFHGLFQQVTCPASEQLGKRIFDLGRWLCCSVIRIVSHGVSFFGWGGGWLLPFQPDTPPVSISLIHHFRSYLGSLDDAVDISDAVHIWVSSKLPGVAVPRNVKQFAHEPN